MNKSDRKIPVYLKLAMVLLSPLLFLSASELILTSFESDLYYQTPFFPINRDINFPEIYEKDQKLFWKFRRNFQTRSQAYSEISYRINSLGLRGPELRRPKDHYRILALGNSCTFGWGVTYENSWTSLLEKNIDILNSALKVEVVNGGIPGYTSYQGRLFLETILSDVNPDMLLFMYGWNDHWAAGKGTPDSLMKMPAPWLITAQNLLGRLKTYKMLRKIILSAGDEMEEIKPEDMQRERRVSIGAFGSNLLELINRARADNIQPVLIIPPIAREPANSQVSFLRLSLLHKIYQTKIARVAEQEGVLLVDLQATFDRHSDLYDNPIKDPIHFNEKGMRVAAEAILAAVSNYLPD